MDEASPSNASPSQLSLDREQAILDLEQLAADRHQQGADRDRAVVDAAQDALTIEVTARVAKGAVLTAAFTLFQHDISLNQRRGDTLQLQLDNAQVSHRVRQTSLDGEQDKIAGQIRFRHPDPSIGSMAEDDESRRLAFIARRQSSSRRDTAAVARNVRTGSREAAAVGRIDAAARLPRTDGRQENR